MIINIYNKKAITLVELIIATVLVSVVLLGIFAVNSVLSSNNQDYGQRYLVKSATQTTLNHILNNAALAVGSAATDGSGNAVDLGILIGTTNYGAPDTTCVGDDNSFCIHQASGANILNNTTTYPNGIWLCYTFLPATYQIEWCAELYDAYVAPNVNVNPRGASSCPTAVTNNTIIPAGASPTFLGSAYSITNPAGSTLLQTPVFVTSGPLLFSINILNCLNDSATSCNHGVNGTSSDPVNNPEVAITGSVTPSQESM